MSDIRKIVEAKLKHCRKRLEQLKISGTETAIEDYKTRIYLLEDILQDADEANGDNTGESGLHLQNVSQRSELLAFAKEMQNIGFNELDDAEIVVDIYLKANCG